MEMLEGGSRRGVLQGEFNGDRNVGGRAYKRKGRFKGGPTRRREGLEEFFLRGTEMLAGVSRRGVFRGWEGLQEASKGSFQRGPKCRRGGV